MNSFLVREDISNLIIGKLTYNDRIDKEIIRAINYGGYYSFINAKFPFLLTSNCIWTNTEYGSVKAFALNKINDSKSKLYGEEKTSTCNIVPLLLVNKLDL